MGEPERETSALNTLKTRLIQEHNGRRDSTETVMAGATRRPSRRRSSYHEKARWRVDKLGFHPFNDVVILWHQVVFMLALLSLLVYLVIDFCTAQYTIDMAEALMVWLESTSTMWVMLFLVGFAMVWTICMGFTSVICIGIGYVLKERWGTALAITTGTCTAFLGVNLGAAAAFWLGRSVLGDCASRMIRHYAVLEGVDLALVYHGRHMNILLRLAPFMPTNVMIYVMGVTSTTFVDFCWGFLGGIPYMVFCVYFGTLASSASDIGSGFDYSSTTFIVALTIGVAVTIVLGYYIYVYTKENIDVLVESAHSIERDRRTSRDQNGTGLGLTSLSRHGSQHGSQHDSLAPV